MWTMVWIMISDLFCLFDITWFSKAAKFTKKTGLSHSSLLLFSGWYGGRRFDKKWQSGTWEWVGEGDKKQNFVTPIVRYFWFLCLFIINSLVLGELLLFSDWNWLTVLSDYTSAIVFVISILVGTKVSW